MVLPKVCDDVCAPWRDEIWKNHKGGQVYWNNFSPYLWPKNKWEVAKVYMGRGNSNHNSTDTFDISAFLNLMSNCLHFKRFAKNTLLTQVTNVRNNIMHNANFEVKAEQLKQYLERIKVLGKALEEHAPEFQILDKEIDELQNLDFTVIMSAMETKEGTEPSVHTESEERAKRFLSMELDIMKEKMECLAQEYEGDKENMLKPEELQCVRQFLEENKDLKESLVPQWERLKEVQEQHGQQIDSLTGRVDELEKKSYTSDPEWDTDIRMYKNHLFEYARKHGWTEPVFTQIPESTGFRGQVSIKSQTFTGTRVHRGKRQADQEVAKIALQQLVKETPSEQGDDEDTSVSQTQQSESVSAAGSPFFGSVTVGLDVTVFSDEGGGGIEEGVESAYRKLMPVFGLELSGPGSSYKDAVVQYCLRRDVPAPEEIDKSDGFTLRLKGPITFYDSEGSSKRKQAQQQAAKAALRGLSGVLGKKEVSTGNYIGALKELLEARKLEGVHYDVTQRPVSSGEREAGLRNQESQSQGAERQRERESGQATERSTEETIEVLGRKRSVDDMPGRDGRIEDTVGSCRISETPTMQSCQSPKSQVPLQPHATETQTATALSEERSVSGDGGRFLGCVKVTVKKELEPAEALSQEGAVQAAYSSLLNALCLGPTTGLDGGDRRDSVLEFFTRSKCRPPVEKLETTDHGGNRCSLMIDGELTFYSPAWSSKKQQAEQWAAKEALRCLVGLLGGNDSNLSGETNYKGRLQELLAKQGSTAMIEYSVTERATVGTVAAPVQVPDGSAVIGAGVPSLIPPVTMDTASEDSAQPPAKMIRMDDMPVRDGRIEDAVASCRISESPKSQVPLQPHATETQTATASSEERSVSGDGGRFLGCVKVTVKKELEAADALSQEGAVQAAYSSLLNALCLGPTTGLARGDVLEFFTRSKCRPPVEKLETAADGKHRCTLMIDGEFNIYSPEGSSRKQQAEQWAAKEALRRLVGLLGGKESNLSGETNYKGRLQELLAKQGSTAMIEYSVTERATVSTVAAPVQVPDGSAVIGPGQQAGVPSAIPPVTMDTASLIPPVTMDTASLIPPVTMDTASEDSAPSPAEKNAKSDGPMEEIRQFLPLVSVKPGTVVCESVNFEEKWECRVSVSLECFTFQDHRSFTSKKDASHSAYLTLGCAGQICQPDESKVKEKVNQHFSQRSFPLPKDVYKQPEPLKFCCSLTNITCVFTYTGTDSSEASARQAAFRTALSCVSPLMGFPLVMPTRAEETEHRLKTLLETAACVNTTTDQTSTLYRSSAMLTFAGFCMETVGEGSKKETRYKLSQCLLTLLQGPDTASTSKDQSMRNALQEWFAKRRLKTPVFEDTEDGKFGTRITFSAPLCLYSEWQDSHEKAGRRLVDELKRRF